jgi:hypothetical protein
MTSFVRGLPPSSKKKCVFTTSVERHTPIWRWTRPEKIGLIPGVLQHASPEVSERHYNLARSVQAGKRFAAHLAEARIRLRLLATKPGAVRAFNNTLPAGDEDPSSQ